MKSCKQCGAPLNDNASYCNNCGTTFSKTEEPPTKKKSHATKKVLVIGAAVVFVCVALAVVVITVVLPNSKYNAAVALMNDGNYDEAIAAFAEMKGYKDSNIKIADCQDAIKEANYKGAVEKLNNGEIGEAYETFLTLKGYKDSDEMIAEIQKMPAYKDYLLKNAHVGSTVKFGSYEQDDDRENGKEDIEWTVVEIENGKMLVLCDYALDCQPYNTFTASDAQITWETCSLRKWLNESFFNTAFSADEQQKIATSPIVAESNPEYQTSAGNDTNDKVFLLSISEAEMFFSYDEERICTATDYAKSRGVDVSDNYKAAREENMCVWWLRSPGAFPSSAATVVYDGSISTYGEHAGGNAVNNDVAIRPAMWIIVE